MIDRSKFKKREIQLKRKNGRRAKENLTTVDSTVYILMVEKMPLEFSWLEKMKSNKNQ